MTAIVLTPTWVSDRGTERPDFTNPTQTVEQGWRVQPIPVLRGASKGVEDAEGRQAVRTVMKAFGPADTVLTPHDRLRVDGVDYEVSGPVEPWPSLTGCLAHVEVVLERVEG